MREHIDETVAPTDEQVMDVMGREPAARLFSLDIPEGPSVTILARPLPRATWDRTQSLTDDKRHLAASIIMRDCLLWPDRATWESLMDRFPGIAVGFASRLLRLAGAGMEADTKKL